MYKLHTIIETKEVPPLFTGIIEYLDGSKEWVVNNSPHRLDGPAREWANGVKEWYVDGKRHRLDGPAVTWSNGVKEWFIDGIGFTEASHKAYVEKPNNKSTTCDGKFFLFEGKRYQMILVD